MKYIQAILVAALVSLASNSYAAPVFELITPFQSQASSTTYHSDGLNELSWDLYGLSFGGNTNISATANGDSLFDISPSNFFFTESGSYQFTGSQLDLVFSSQDALAVFLGSVETLPSATPKVASAQAPTASVNEPSTIALLAIGIAGLIVSRKKAA